MEATKSALNYFGQKIVAQNVSEEDYFANYEGHYEWLNGDVIEMSPVTSKNLKVQRYLMHLFDAYFSHRPIGDYRFDPFAMRLKGISSRQPDIQVILGDNQDKLKETMLDGAANIVIEIISPATAAIDRGIKFEEYQKGKVPEYWMIDPQAKEALFYRLNDEGNFIAQKQENGQYHSEQLPDFVLNIAILWEEKLPNMLEVLESMKATLGQ